MASATPPLPAEVQAPPAARGRKGGSHWDPPRAGKGQERGGARKECAEAPVYPGVGRAPQPCPDLLPPSGPGAPTPTPREAVGGHGAGRGACFEPSGAAWQARPVQVGLPTPAALRKLLPSSPHPLRGAQTPEPSRCPEPGDSQVGGQCREVPRPLHFPETPTGKLSHRQQPLPVTLAGRDPPQTPTPLRRNTRPRPTERGPQPPGTSPGASAAPDQVLPLFLEFMVSPGQPSKLRACPPCPRRPRATRCRPGWAPRSLPATLAPASAPPGAAPRPVPAA